MSKAICIRTPLPGPRSLALLEERRRFVAVGIAEAKHGIFFERAEGARLVDVDGNVFLDFSGGIGCLNAGHSAPRVVDRAREQLTKLQHACFQVAPYEPYVALARKLCQIVPIGGPTKAALFNSGAEAVENAIKIARAATGRPAVLAFDPGFHGRTLLALSLTSKAFPYRHGFGPFAPEVYRFPIPDVLRRPPGTSVQTSVEHGIAELHRFLKSTVHPASIACAIIEPVIGEGGFIVPPLEFLLDLASTCREHGILLIADEVQTGFGRTGRCLPASGSASSPISSAWRSRCRMDSPFRPSWVAPRSWMRRSRVDWAGPLPATLSRVLRRSARLKRSSRMACWTRAETIGAVVASRFESMVARYPFIAETRGVGAMRALELVEDRVSLKPDQGRTERILALAATRGLLLLSAGLYGNVIRTLMPLTMTDAELDEGLRVLESCFADAA